MKIERETKEFEKYKGLPGIETVLRRSLRIEEINEPITNQNYLFSITFLILIESAFLPLAFKSYLESLAINYLLISKKIEFEYLCKIEIYLSAITYLFELILIFYSIKNLTIFKTLVIFYGVDMFICAFELYKVKKEKEEKLKKTEIILIIIFTICFIIVITRNLDFKPKESILKKILFSFFVVFSSILQKIFDFEISEFIENNYFIETNFNFEEYRVFFLTHVELIAIAIYCIGLSFIYIFTSKIFEIHLTAGFYWLIIALVFNLREIVGILFNLTFENLDLSNHFSFKFLTVIFAHFFVNILQETQQIRNIDWLAYFLLLLTSFEMNQIYFNIETESVAIDCENLNISLLSQQSRESLKESNSFKYSELRI